MTAGGFQLLQIGYLLALVYLVAGPSKALDGYSFRAALMFLVASIVCDVFVLGVFLGSIGWIDERWFVLLSAGLPAMCLVFGLVYVGNSIEHQLTTNEPRNAEADRHA